MTNENNLSVEFAWWKAVHRVYLAALIETFVWARIAMIGKNGEFSRALYREGKLEIFAGVLRID